MIVNNPLDSVDRTKNRVNGRMFQRFPEHAHQRSIDGTGRATGLSNRNIHTKNLTFPQKIIQKQVKLHLQENTILLYLFFSAVSSCCEGVEFVGKGKVLIKRLPCRAAGGRALC